METEKPKTGNFSRKKDIALVVGGSIFIFYVGYKIGIRTGYKTGLDTGTLIVKASVLDGFLGAL